MVSNSEKINNEIKVEKVIRPKPNLLIASIQNNVSFHDVNPIKEISGTRNAFYIAISCNNPVWKKIKVNNFNILYNKNRCKLNSFFKLKKVLESGSNLDIVGHLLNRYWNLKKKLTKNTSNKKIEFRTIVY